jgi:uroporphyrinogen decarboxylase
MGYYSSFERVSAALELEEPDRVPTIPLVTYALSSLTQSTVWEFCHDGDKLAKAIIKGYEEFGYDAVIAFADVYLFAEAVGVLLDFSVDGPPKPLSSPIKSVEDVEKMDIPDPKRDGRLPVLLRAIEVLSKRFRDEVPIYSGGQGPFSLSAEIIGLERFLMSLYRDMELVEEMVRFSTDYMVEVGSAEYDAGAHILHLGDSFAGPSVTSPKIFEKIALPSEREVFNKWKALGAYTSLHICGDSGLIWPMIPGTGCDNFEVDYMIDMAEVKNYFMGKICIMGNIDPSGIIHHGTIDEVAKTTAKCIEDAAGGGGFILSSGCLIMPGFPHENLKAMVETAGKLGKYPRR